MTLAAWITVLVLVLVGSTGSGGVIYWLLNRKSQSVVDSKIESERENFNAEAAERWQKILDESQTKAYKVLNEQCNACLDKLGGMEDIVDNLIDAMEALLAEDTPTPQSRANGRALVRLARRARSAHR